MQESEVIWHLPLVPLNTFTYGTNFGGSPYMRIVLYASSYGSSFEKQNKRVVPRRFVLTPVIDQVPALCVIDIYYWLLLDILLCCMNVTVVTCFFTTLINFVIQEYGVHFITRVGRENYAFKALTKYVLHLNMSVLGLVLLNMRKMSFKVSFTSLFAEWNGPCFKSHSLCACNWNPYTVYSRYNDMWGWLKMYHCICLSI